MKLNHFGFLTKSIEKSFSSFSSLGYTTCSETIRDLDRGIDILFIKAESGEVVELIAPIPNAENCIVDNLVKTKTGTYYHSCYETQDIEATIKTLEDNGYMLIAPPAPAIAFDNQPVAFMASRHAGIIELLEVA